MGLQVVYSGCFLGILIGHNLEKLKGKTVWKCTIKDKEASLTWHTHKRTRALAVHTNLDVCAANTQCWSTHRPSVSPAESNYAHRKLVPVLCLGFLTYLPIFVLIIQQHTLMHTSLIPEFWLRIKQNRHVVFFVSLSGKELWCFIIFNPGYIQIYPNSGFQYTGVGDEMMGRFSAAPYYLQPEEPLLCFEHEEPQRRCCDGCFQFQTLAAAFWISWRFF